MNCYSLREADIPSLRNVNEYTFQYCSSLSYVDFPLLENTEYETFYQTRSLTHVNLPSLKNLANYSLEGSALKTLYLPNVTVLTASLRYCSSLTYVDLPKVETVEEYNYPFEWDYALNFVSMPMLKDFPHNSYSSEDSEYTDGQMLFLYTENLTYVNLENCERIRDRGLSWQKKPLTVYAPNCKRIDYCAFANCSALSSIYIPNVETLGRYVFEYSDGDLSFTLDKLTAINEGAFMRCTGLKYIDMPNVTSIGNWSLEDCINLTFVSAPQATHVYRNAFLGSWSIKEIHIDNVTHIENGAFDSCSSLKCLSLRNLQYIDTMLTLGTNNLTAVYLPPTPPSLTHDWYYYYDQLPIKFHVPSEESLQDYFIASNWNTIPRDRFIVD